MYITYNTDFTLSSDIPEHINFNINKISFYYLYLRKCCKLCLFECNILYSLYSFNVKYLLKGNCF